MFVGQHKGICEKPGVLCALDDLDAELANAYLHLCQALYIEPADTPRQMNDIFFCKPLTPVHCMHHDHGKNRESMVDCMADGLQSILHSLLAAVTDSKPDIDTRTENTHSRRRHFSFVGSSVEDTHVCESPLLYAYDVNSGGGLLSILSAIFESTLIEMSDGTLPSLKNTDRQLRDLLCGDAQPAFMKILQHLPSSVRTRDQHEQLGRFVTALEISSAFPNDLLAGIKKELVKFVGLPNPNLSVAKSSSFVLESMAASERVDSWNGFVRVVESAFGESHRCLPWAKALKRFPEEPGVGSQATTPASAQVAWWHPTRDSEPDTFVFQRKLVALIITACNYEEVVVDGNGHGKSSTGKRVRQAQTLKDGQLEKLGRRNEGWQTCKLKLTENLLQWVDGGRVVGPFSSKMIRLQDITCVAPTVEGVFEIHHTQDPHNKQCTTKCSLHRSDKLICQFRAATAVDRDSWVSAVQRAMQNEAMVRLVRASPHSDVPTRIQTTGKEHICLDPDFDLLQVLPILFPSCSRILTVHNPVASCQSSTHSCNRQRPGAAQDGGAGCRQS